MKQILVRKDMEPLAKHIIETIELLGANENAECKLDWLSRELIRMYDQGFDDGLAALNVKRATGVLV